MAPIPSTILTGFLGAGKTTLLNQILQESHGYRIAVIENEFGQENIDSEILVHDSAEQIVEMSNGCICCTVRGDLIEALASLADRRASGELNFDRVVIETTGLANPGPVAQTFFMDDKVAKHYKLDAVITLVDAQHAMQQLDNNVEAQQQVGFADRILLSKTDLTDQASVDTLTARLKRINPRSPVIKADFGRVSIAEVIDLHGFNLNDKLEISPDFLNAEGGEHDHACGEHCQHTPTHHMDEVAAFTFRSEQPFDTALLEEFLSAMIQVYGPQMLRYKGILYIKDVEHKLIFQGVHQLMGSDIGGSWDEKETRNSKMVFIGKNLPKEIFLHGLAQCLV